MSSTTKPILLPTTLVGSYPQPDWLIDRASLGKQMPPRVRARELWRVDPERLEEAQDDATLLAIRDQERAGLDIVTDGEQRRESYSNRFATALDGIDLDNPGKTPNRTGGFTIVPRVVGKIRRRHPVEVRDVKFLRANTDRMIKMTVPGPFTLAQQCEDHHYGDEQALALDYAAAVNAEIKDLFAAGADVVQLDEPWLQARPEKAKAYGLKALARALDGVTGTIAVHLCFGYAQMVKNEAVGLFVFAGARAIGGTADLHRGGAAETRPRGAEVAAVEDHHAWRDRSVRHDGRDAGNRRRAHPRCAWRTYRPSGSSLRRTAA